MGSRAAVLRSPEGLARASARHRVARRPRHPQLRRATFVHVRHAPRVPAPVAAPSSSGRGPHPDANVVAVDKAHVVEVLVASRRPGEGELRQGGGRLTADGAEERTAAVAGVAAAGGGSSGVEGAASARPEAAGPARRGGEGSGGIGAELEAATSKAKGGVTRQRGGPNCILALVVECEGSDGDRRRRTPE